MSIEHDRPGAANTEAVEQHGTSAKQHSGRPRKRFPKRTSPQASGRDGAESGPGVVKASAPPSLRSTEVLPEQNAPIDWATFFESPPPKPDWLVFPLVQRGQHALLFSETKAGKSLLMLDLLSRACNGVQLDDSETSPIRVLYLDFENSQDDLRLRLDSLQASANGLTGLVYISFPSLPPLDTREGGKDLLNLGQVPGSGVAILR